MVLSPGTRYRNSIENLAFNELNIFEKIIYNIPNFVYYTFIINTFMLMLMSVSNYFLIKNNVKKSWLKYFLMVFMEIVPLFTIIGYILSMFIDSSLFVVDYNNLFIILYWIIYLIILSILIFVFDKKDFKTLFLFLIGLMSNVVMLISPTWGYRTSFFTYLILCIVALKVINVYVKENKLIIYLINSCMVFSILFYLVFYINIWRCQINLEKSIKKQLKEDKPIVYIDKFPSFANCNINPENEYHIGKYKLYYGIPEDKELVLVEGKWKYVILYNG